MEITTGMVHCEKISEQNYKIINLLAYLEFVFNNKCQIVLYYSLSFQSFVISSSVLPLVSGTSLRTKIAAIMHITP